MQLYKGLPIITNKVSLEEQNGIPHHLLGTIGLDERPFMVGKYVDNALAIIQEIRARNKLPIIVGGTHYYIQSLLFHDNLATNSSFPSPSNVPVNDKVDDVEPHAILSAPTTDVLSELRRVDPVMANRWHPNDRRKIQRSLEIYLNTGRRASEVYAEQHSKLAMLDKIDGTTSGLRDDALILWVHCDENILAARLDSRVDKMVKRGLLDEVKQLAAYQTDHIEDVDTTSGIWISIGYKEFLSYIKYIMDQDETEEQHKTSLEARKLFDEAVERTKISTRQYAKRQLKWIRIKLMNAVQDEAKDNNRKAPNLFVLNGDNIADFRSEVMNKAETVVQAFLESQDMPSPESINPLASGLLKPKRKLAQDWERKHCEICAVDLLTESSWSLHMSSRRHKKLSALNRRQLSEEEIID